MLGDKIDELTAKVTGTRVIAIEGGAVKASKWEGGRHDSRPHSATQL
jgi:hypothetical protein